MSRCAGIGACLPINRADDIRNDERDTSMPTQKTSARKRKAAAKSAERHADRRIDELEDASASVAEKSRRKKRLLEGPEEFRSMRSGKAKGAKRKAR
jgi:hypothetical protein